MKSLNTFPKPAMKAFDPDTYGTDPREQVAQMSQYTGDVGIEIELEGTGFPGLNAPAVGRSVWQYKTDGSLRAPGGIGAGGAEYVLSEPIKEADVPTAIGNLFSHLRQHNVRIVQSTRCSTHVHLNMQGIKLNQLASFVVLWGTLEDALSLWCGDHRAGNHFALRLSDCDTAVARWISGFKYGDFRFANEQRYLALNPACLQTFGSLEVRMMGGAENEADVIKWVSWLQRIKKAALSSRFENPESIAGTFSGVLDYADFAREILGSDCVDELQRCAEAAGLNLNRLLVDGFRRVQGLCYVLPWYAVIDECRKPFIPNPFQPAKARKVRIDRGGLITPAPLRMNEDEEYFERDE